ncbi:MAG TPA: NAD-dependent epimerase/dehydratase family protein [Pedobacter sp.]|nr:NAD-dependent epimerase/dehydratase family protein [Pedobacter sp.]
MKETEKILVIGACGQIGRELILALRTRFGKENVTAADIQPSDKIDNLYMPYAELNVMDKAALEQLIAAQNFSQIYHLAAMLSANGERNPQQAWQLNMDGLLNVLDLSVKYNVKKVFWPSSIAVFGPDSQKKNCPQLGVTEPSTIYGISKAAGEYWCKYYFEKHGLDVRSLRYPGLISYTGAPGGGTTDYAVEIFHSAAKKETFTCFLKEDTALPMMYMRDAIRATLELMDAPAENLLVRTAYNLGGLSFTPAEIHSQIAREVEGFEISYKPDFRQKIADSWPQSIDDSAARKDWQWKPEYNLNTMVTDMLSKILTRE